MKLKIVFNKNKGKKREVMIREIIHSRSK